MNGQKQHEQTEMALEKTKMVPKRIFFFTFSFYIYLFILAAPGPICSARDLHCGMWDL